MSEGGLTAEPGLDGEKSGKLLAPHGSRGQQLEVKELLHAEILSKLSPGLLQVLLALFEFLFSLRDFFLVGADFLTVAYDFFAAGAVADIPAQFGAVLSQFLNVLAQLRAVLANVLFRVANVDNLLLRFSFSVSS